MANVKLKEAIKGKQTITIEKKPALYASKCDCCGLVFQVNYPMPKGDGALTLTQA